MTQFPLDTYVYALYTTIILSVIAFVVVSTYFRKSEIPVLSVKLYQLYFILGTIGWIVLALKDLSHISIDLTLTGIAYIICSFILFFAVIRAARKIIIIKLLISIHIIVIVAIILPSNDATRILVVTIYGLILYPIISYFSFKRAFDFQNIGYAIIGSAALLIVCGIPFQLYYLEILKNANYAYIVSLVTSSTGYVLVGIGFITSILINEHKQLTSLALNDPLTGLLNRRGLDYEARVVIAAAKRNKTCISAISLDIDYFKKINDQYGHQTGDVVLQELAKILLNCPRESDICCRLGGEEFVILLPETQLQSAIIIAERIRFKIESTTIACENFNINLTASFGVSSMCETIDIDNLLKNADKVLYKAKSDGRNQVCAAPKL